MDALVVCALGFASFAPGVPAHGHATRFTALATSKEDASDDANPFENAMRKLTGDEDYKFGDLTRSTLDGAGKATRSTLDGAGKALTGDEDYEFGDITKKAVTSAKEGVASLAGKSVDEYEFGDVARRVMGETDKAIAGWRDDAFDEMMPTLWDNFLGRMNEKEKGDVVVAMAQLVACYFLAFGLIFNLTVSGSIAISWALSAFRRGVSPLASAAAWSAFLTSQSTLRLALDPLLMPVRMFAAALLTRYYRRGVVYIQERLPYRDELPMVNRCLALALAWAVCNGLAVAGLTAGVVWAISRAAGVPMLP